MMKFNLFILSAFLLFLSCNEDKQPVAQSLINGTDLSGWHIDVPAMDINPNTINPFIIRDGMLVTL
ncbi:MAG: hypothetical protein WC199_08235, partial [Dysgonamonadaceae bacterium]